MPTAHVHVPQLTGCIIPGNACCVTNSPSGPPTLITRTLVDQKEWTWGPGSKTNVTYSKYYP